ncbi:glycerol-3-phosphate responsive antiterminator [Bacillus sp. FJAT-49705]|uniref:Glycerol uptake operon antiterminator regulatory protein n=1 Tax=Cytobacillus citreus TaxID=2833586 RepID=A0ABS5NVY1_9BACI|nr:glycerol-3-phosphate responsive antiterminator [Cytobacillus citreus]MBS4191881.1 glycerol-3-phosphate responsive antiterminator [Cytobacillus citreus]
MERNIIAAIKLPKQIDLAIKYKDNIDSVFLLLGNVQNIKEYVDVFKKENIPVYVHIEMIQGLKLDSYGLTFISKYVKPDGVITTKTNMVTKCKQHNLKTILRSFMIDSEMLKNTIEAAISLKPDILEIMPSTTTYVIKEIKKKTDIPIITGGLVDTIDIFERSLKDGAIAVSTSNSDIWKINK